MGFGGMISMCVLCCDKERKLNPELTTPVFMLQNFFMTSCVLARKRRRLRAAGREPVLFLGCCCQSDDPLYKDYRPSMSKQHGDTNSRRWIARRTCWLLRKGKSKRKNVTAAFAVWGVHVTVMQYLSAVELESTEFNEFIYALENRPANDGCFTTCMG